MHRPRSEWGPWSCRGVVGAVVLTGAGFGGLLSSDARPGVLGSRVRWTSTVTELEEVPNVDRRRFGHPPKADHVRLRRAGDGQVRAGSDLSGGSGACGPLAVPLRRDERGRVRDGGVHRVAVRRGGVAQCRDRAASGRAGRDLCATRTQAAGQDGQGRRQAAAGAARGRAVAGVLHPTVTGAGVAGTAGAVSRPARRAHRLGAARSRDLFPPGHHGGGRGGRDPRLP